MRTQSMCEEPSYIDVYVKLREYFSKLRVNAFMDTSPRSPLPLRFGHLKAMIISGSTPCLRCRQRSWQCWMTGVG